MRTAKNVEIPDDFAAALNENPDALAKFEAMPPSHQREYAEAIAEAKKPETKRKRIEGAIVMILEWGRQREASKKRT